MRLTELSENELLARCEGFGPEAPEPVWRERVRNELSALGTSLRHTLIERVIARWTLAPLDREALRTWLRALIDDLADLGDLYVGDGGLVAPAPLLALDVTETQHLLLGTIPSATIARALEDPVLTNRRVRTVTLARMNRQALSEAVEGLGGQCLSVAEWAALDSALATLDAWREELAARENSLGSSADMPEGELEAYVPRASDGAALHRWRPLSAEGGPWLLRVRRMNGWAFRWVGASSTLALTRTEANRTVAMLDAQAGVPRTLRVTREEGAVRIETRAMLPRQEYRYALAVSDRVSSERGVTTYWLAPHVVSSVLETLHTRLGLRIEHEGEAPR